MDAGDSVAEGEKALGDDREIPIYSRGISRRATIGESPQRDGREGWGWLLRGFGWVVGGCGLVCVLVLSSVVFVISTAVILNGGYNYISPSLKEGNAHAHTYSNFNATRRMVERGRVCMLGAHHANDPGRVRLQSIPPQDTTSAWGGLRSYQSLIFIGSRSCRVAENQSAASIDNSGRGLWRSVVLGAVYSATCVGGGRLHGGLRAHTPAAWMVFTDPQR